MAKTYKPGKNPNSLANLRMYQPGHAVDREMLSRAGRASAEAKKRRRLIREALRDILDAPICGDVQGTTEIMYILSSMGIDCPTTADAIALAATSKAIHGDIEAARFVRDSVGEKPSHTVELDVTDTPIEYMDLSQLSDEQLMDMLMLQPQ